jgi:xylulokinase
MAIVVGIDVGTQSTKVLCYHTESQSIAASAQAPHELISRDDGSREQEASWWTDAIESCFSQIPQNIRDAVVAIGVSGQQHGFVPVDASGNVLHPVKLWNDTSTAAECVELSSLAGGDASLLANEGNLILPGYTASKILWFKKHHRELYDKMAKILLPHDYINFYLTGEYTMEYGDASGTALLDIPSRTWSSRLLTAIDSQRDLSSALPRLIEAHEIAGKTTGETARRLGIPQGIPVSSGGGDNMMGAIGTGTVKDGTLTMSLGTSGTIYGASDKPIIDPKGLLAAFCSSTGSWLPLLCTMNCTVASEVTRTLFKKGVKEFDAGAAQAPIGCEGVVMLPYFNGERTPNYPKGKGCLMGFNLTNMTEGIISRAAMESAIYGLKLGLESFQDLGYTAKEVRLIGGGAKSMVWRQMVADICELPVVVPVISEAAALGGALQAWWALRKEQGEDISLEEIVAKHVLLDEKSACLPIEEHIPQYRKAYKTYCAYVSAVKPLFA